MAFIGALFLLAPAALAARVQRLRVLIRPVALTGLVCAIATSAHALARLQRWDIMRSYGELVAAGSTETNPGLLAAMLIPLWPYAAVAVGTVLMVLYALILWRKRWLIAFMTPKRPQPGRVARERARVARFDE